MVPYRTTVIVPVLSEVSICSTGTTVLNGKIWQELELEPEPKLRTKVKAEPEPKINNFGSATPNYFLNSIYNTNILNSNLAISTS